jgi:hypothetical protein
MGVDAGTSKFRVFCFRARFIVQLLTGSRY